MKKLQKTTIIILILGFWFYWDLNNADSGSLLENVPAFKVLNKVDAVSSATAKVAMRIM